MKKQENPYQYKIKGLKNFSEFRVSDMMAKNIIELVHISKSHRISHEVAKSKIRKMFVFGYAKALYDLDKKKHSKFIKQLLKQAEELNGNIVGAIRCIAKP